MQSGTYFSFHLCSFLRSWELSRILVLEGPACSILDIRWVIRRNTREKNPRNLAGRSLAGKGARKGFQKGDSDTGPKDAEALPALARGGVREAARSPWDGAFVGRRCIIMCHNGTGFLYAFVYGTCGTCDLNEKYKMKSTCEKMHINS